MSETTMNQEERARHLRTWMRGAIAYQGLSAVCVTATEAFGMSCVHLSGPAG